MRLKIELGVIIPVYDVWDCQRL